MYDVLLALAFIAMLAVPAIVASAPLKESDDDS